MVVGHFGRFEDDVGILLGSSKNVLAQTLFVGAIGAIGYGRVGRFDAAIEKRLRVIRNT